MPGYFNNFPIITYNNNKAVNITKRAKIIELFKTNAVDFYNYTIRNNQKPDYISRAYYNSPEYDWIIFLCNNILDPYYDWTLNTTEFESYLAKKYESAPGLNDGITVAQSTIAYYKQTPKDYYINNANNDYADANAYALNPAKYSGYSKITLDNDVLLTPIVVPVGNISLTTGSTVVNANSCSFANVPVGQGLYIFSSNTSNFIANYSNEIGVVATKTSNTQLTLNYPSTITNNSLTVAYVTCGNSDYYPVSAYEDEVIKNENKKFIKLLDDSLVSQIENQLSVILNV